MTVHRCPDCRCQEDEAFALRPAVSTEAARRAAIEAAAEAVRVAKDRRTGAGR